MDENGPGPEIPPETAWPRRVRHAVADLRNDGLDPLVQRSGPEWRVCLAGKRVQATVSFRQTRNSSKLLGTTILIDGKTPEPGTVSGTLAGLWAEYEEDVGTAGLLMPLTAMEPSRVPDPVRRLAALAQSLGGELGYAYDSDRRHWHAGYDFPGERPGGIRFVFARVAGGRWEMLGRTGIILVVDGTDKSAEVDGDMALAVSMAPPASAGLPRAPEARASGAQGVRPGSGKGTVMRN